jgi:hypothetical protein
MGMLVPEKLEKKGKATQAPKGMERLAVDSPLARRVP